MQTQTQRLFTAENTARLLAKAGVPSLGPNKLNIIGRGNDYVREDGQIVTIFNVLAFRTMDDAKAAAAKWKEGKELEDAGDQEGAHELYQQARNMLMSFSVPKANADGFRSALQVIGNIEEVEASEKAKAAGINTAIVLNNARPVAIVENTASVSNLFKADEEEAPAEETKAPATAKAAKPRANAK